MSGAWVNYSCVLFVQLVLFVTHAYYMKRLHDVPHILVRSLLIGLVFGLLCDLILGKFFGFSAYALGFGSLFLILNGALAYGIFAANTLLLQHARLLYFYIWTFSVMVVYEIANHFFPVWRWEFVLPPAQFLGVLSVGYFWGAVNVAVIWHVFLGERFYFINAVLKK